MSDLIHYDELESTNDEARRLTGEGAPHGTAIVARTQRAGRGRLGRTWHSPDAGNLYLSLIHRSDLPADGLSGITLDAATAVADVLETAGLKVGLKWPNDLLVDDRKVGGILTELLIEGSEVTVIVGVGVNVNANVDDFPAELHPIATSVALETGEAHDIDWLAKRIASALRSKLAAFEVRGAPDLVAYRMRDVLVGQTVEFEGQGGSRRGVVNGLDPSGALLVSDDADGGTVAVRAGEVRLQVSEASS